MDEASLRYNIVVLTEEVAHYKQKAEHFKTESDLLFEWGLKLEAVLRLVETSSYPDQDEWKDLVSLSKSLSLQFRNVFGLSKYDRE
jgi:hypothetical protein